MEGEVKGPKAQNTRGDTTASLGKLKNYTFLYGCNPSEGVAADTEFVQVFIKHVTGLFDPDTGSINVPACFSAIDVKKQEAKPIPFESTSSHLGRNLTMLR